MHYARRDIIKMISRKGKDRRARAGETDAQQAWLGTRVHGVEDVREARDEMFAVRLVDFVLHGEIDHVRVERELAESRGEQGCTLEVVDLSSFTGVSKE